MLSFTHPWFLLLALLVPLVMWRWLKRSRPALRYSDTALLATLPPGRSQWAHLAGAAMRAGALLFLVIALVGPRWPDNSTRIPTEGIAIELVVDVSGSMAETDFTWEGERISRLEAVRRAFKLFVVGGDGPDGQHLNGRPGDLVGLLTFGTRPESSCPLTLSHSVLIRMLDREKPRGPDDGRTNIGDALAVGLERLRVAAPKRKVLVLLSDGEHNVYDNPVPNMMPLQAANLAANLHIPIYTIDAGGEVPSLLEPGANDAAKTRQDGIEKLKDMAKMTGGHYFQARDTRSLLDVCQRIDGLERAPIESFQYRRYYEAFAWLGMMAFVLLMGLNALELTYWQRLP